MAPQAAPALPQPEDLTPREKEDAMGAWLMAFGALHLGLPVPFLGLAASWIYHAINGKKSRFTGFHSLQSFLLSIPVSVLSAAWLVWGVVLLVRIFDRSAFPSADAGPFWIYSLVCLAVYLVYLGCCAVGAWRARQGRFLYFPIFGRWAFSRSFRPEVDPAPTIRNIPPKGF